MGMSLNRFCLVLGAAACAVACTAEPEVTETLGGDETGSNPPPATDGGGDDTGAPSQDGEEGDDESTSAMTDDGPAGPYCGNDIIDGDDICDGIDLGGVTCEELGFDIGELACTVNCGGHDLTGCGFFECGNGKEEGDEDCDGTVADATCATEGYDNGTLFCTPECEYNFDQCGTCGDRIVSDGEDCDIAAQLESSCQAEGFMTGTLACGDDCLFDTSNCSTCGNDLAEGFEDCDADDLGAETCVSQGFDSGELACAESCQFETAGCGTCGNDVLDGDEVCDALDFGAATCLTEGFDSGTLTCAPDCAGYDTLACATCGDGVIAASEQCEGADLGGESCASLGFGRGELGCSAVCSFDIAGCDFQEETVPFPSAGDPTFNMAGTLPWNQGDWVEGVRATAIPSIGQFGIHVDIITNGLSACGVQEAEVSVNGTPVGLFQIVQGTVSIDESYVVAPPIVGPNYTIRYETTASVAPGCGAAGYNEMTSTVTFTG